MFNELSVKTNAEEVVAVEATAEVKVWLLVVVVTPKVEPVDKAIAPPEELPMLVAAPPDAFKLTVPPVTVSPAEPVINPAEVIVPEPVVAIVPVVEIEIFEARSPPTIEPLKFNLL